MARKGENIYKRKDGRWEGRYKKDNLNKYSYIYGKSYKEVKETLKILKVESNLKNSKKTDIYLKNIAVNWLEKAKWRVKVSSYVRYYTIVYNHIIPFLGDYKLNYLNNEIIEKFIFQYLKRKKELSNKTINDILTILKAILKYAKIEKYPINLDIEIKFTGNQTNKMQVLNRKEQMIFEKFLTSNTDNKKLGVLICLYTGIRLGEMCSLTWQDISFKNNTLEINKTIQRIKNLDLNATTKTKLSITPPKTSKSMRLIPLPKFLMTILKKYHNENLEANILTGKTNKFIEPRTYQNIFKSFIKSCGIDNINFHALRHTFATRCIEIGFDIKSLSEILGHSNVNITLNKYVHSSMEHKQSHMQKLNKLFPKNF